MTTLPIIVIVGFSASGKDTIARAIEKQCDCHFVVSTTTRPPRDCESEGNPYHFVSSNDFMGSLMRGEFVEVRRYKTQSNGIWRYGVRSQDVSDSKLNVVVLDIHGLRAFKGYYGNRVVSVFIDCDDEVRRQRTITRGDYCSVEFERRMQDDKKRFPENVIANELDYRVESTNAIEPTDLAMGILASSGACDLDK